MDLGALLRSWCMRPILCRWGRSVLVTRKKSDAFVPGQVRPSFERLGEAGKGRCRCGVVL